MVLASAFCAFLYLQVSHKFVKIRGLFIYRIKYVYCIMFAEKLIVNNTTESSVSLRSNFIYRRNFIQRMIVYTGN